MERPFRCGGMLRFPVRTRSENFVLDSEIRFGLEGQLSIAEAAERAGDFNPGSFLRGNMPCYVGEALQTLWGDAAPLDSFSGPWKALEDAILRVSEASLGRNGMRLESVTVQALWIVRGDMEILHAHEDRELLARRLEGFDVGAVHVDEACKPELTGAGTPLPQQKAEAWSCCRCGSGGLTGRFCTECGAPRPK